MGYRIDIDHSGCINCGICMDTCPVEALDMSRPTTAGIETAGFGRAAGLDDGAPDPGRGVHRLRHLHRRVPGRRHDPRRRTRRDGLWRPARARSTARRRRAPGAEPWLPLATVTREALKREHPSPWGGLFGWQTADRDGGVAGLAVDEGRRTEGPEGAVPGRLPCRHGRRPIRRPDRRGALRRGVRGRRRGQSVPVGVRLDLHRAVRKRLPPRRARRTDRDPDAQALRRRARPAPARRPAGDHRSEKVGIVGGGPAGMSAAYYLARLGYPVTVFEAMPVPGGMMAIGIPAYRLPRDVLQAEIARIVGLGVDLRAGHRDGSRLHPWRPRGRGLSRGLPCHRCVEEPAARGSAVTTRTGSCRRPSSSSRSTSAKSHD